MMALLPGRSRFPGKTENVVSRCLNELIDLHLGKCSMLLKLALLLPTGSWHPEVPQTSPGTARIVPIC